jgi:hypothetical protein
MHYFEALKKATHPNQDVADRSYFVNLNDVRNAIKHRGQLPDTKQWSSVGERTFRVRRLVQIIPDIFGRNRCAYLIEDQSTRPSEGGKRGKIAGDFKEALKNYRKHCFWPTCRTP